MPSCINVLGSKDKKKNLFGLKYFWLQLKQVYRVKGVYLLLHRHRTVFCADVNGVIA